MKDATLCFLVKETNNKIDKICLAMKKRGFGAGRWNGVGGKIEEKDGSIEKAVIREAFEEIAVKIKKFSKVAKIDFTFPHKKEFDQVVHVYLAKAWVGEPKESEEMKPEWFSLDKIPYKTMWSDDIYWLPKVLQKNLLQAKFVFSEGDIVKEHAVKIVKKLS